MGRDHPITATSLNNLAGLLQAEGNYTAAKPLYERALAIRERVLGPNHPTTATSLNNLAGLLQAEGDYAAAKPLYERALVIDESVYGVGHPELATDLNNLAALLQLQGDYTAAKPLYERALTIRERALGHDHLTTAQILNNLARLLEAQGDFAAAKPLYERALAIRERCWGPNHPTTATSLNNLAGLLRAQGDLAAAKPLYERALAICERVLGPNHPTTATSLDNLAGLLQAQGDLAAAKPFYRRALGIREQLGGDHPDTATSLNNLAGMHLVQGDYAAAKPLYEQALATRERVLGPNHPDTATSLNNLAGLLQAEGDYAAAKPLYERALEITRHNLKLAAASQSERQQLAMTQNLRYVLDAALSLDRQVKFTGDWAYRSVLSWKGAVYAQQREVRVFRRAVTRTGQPEVLRLFEQLEKTARNLATLALAVPPDLKQIAVLTEQKEHLEGELSRRSGEFHRLQARLEATTERVQAVLPDGMALVDLLEYTDFTPPPAGKVQWNVERRLAAFMVRRGRPIERLDLGPIKPIEYAIAAWRVVLGADQAPAKPTASQAASPAPAPRDRQELGNELRHLVWQPLEPHLQGVQTVLVSPDGVLGQLPWAALPGQKPDTYLIEERAIAVIPVPQDMPELLAQRNGNGQGPEAKEPVPSLVLVGNVNFGAVAGAADAGTSRSAARDTRAGTVGMFQPLPATLGEILTVENVFQQRFLGQGRLVKLEKEAATEGAVRQAAPNSRYLHLATHGFFNPGKLHSALDPEPLQPTTAR